VSDRTRTALLIGGLLMATLILAPLLSGTLRETLIVPLLYVAWTLWLAISRLPQVLFWAIFLAAAGLMAWRSLNTNPLFLPAVKEPPYRNPGQLAILTRWVQDLPHGEYFRRRMARHLLDLTLLVEGIPERPPAQDLAQMIERGDLDLPPQVIDYAQQGVYTAIGPETDNPSRRLLILAPVRWIENWLALRTFREPDTRHLEALIIHLEDELEIPHDADR
jgi:hypothetical protein